MSDIKKVYRYAHTTKRLLKDGTTVTRTEYSKVYYTLSAAKGMVTRIKRRLDTTARYQTQSASHPLPEHTFRLEEAETKWSVVDSE